jgi:hypothetical protein
MFNIKPLSIKKIKYATKAPIHQISLKVGYQANNFSGFWCFRDLVAKNGITGFDSIFNFLTAPGTPQK